ncbi:MAG: methyl-accepting chemotaxis protein, partial [Paracoccaceae bacterium]|nr:methyl-accepting chemotaxis protein [Paracoccaceae bacterium]
MTPVSKAITRSIHGKLFALPLVAAIGIAVCVIASYVGTGMLTKMATEAIEEQKALQESITEFRIGATTLAGFVRAAPSEFDADALVADKEQALQVLAEIRSTYESADLATGADDAIAVLDALNTATIGVFDLSARFAQAQAIELLASDFEPALDGLTALTENKVAAAEAELAALMQSLAATRSYVTLLSAVVAVLSLAACVGLSVLIAARLSKRIGNLKNRIERIAGGDASSPDTIDKGSDELRAMSDALEVFRETLHDKQRLEEAQAEQAADQAHVVGVLASALEKLSEGKLRAIDNTRFNGDYENLRADYNAAIQSVRESIDKISESGKIFTDTTFQLNQTASELAQRTADTARDLESTAAAVSELTQSIHGSKETSQEAMNVAEGASRKAESGRETVDAMIHAMEQIGVASDKIGSVTDLIDNIAFQTG